MNVITLSGGEPLMHPRLEDVVRRIRHHGMIAGMITNGYLLTAARIQELEPRRAWTICRSASTM